MIVIEAKGEKIEIPDKEIWTHRQSGEQILTHTAMQRIARTCGIVPLKSELLFKEADWISINVGVTDGENEAWFIGEASHLNCPEKSPGRSYLACMAYKRGFDKGVCFLAELFDWKTEADMDDFNEGNKRRSSKRDREARNSNTMESQIKKLYLLLSKANNREELETIILKSARDKGFSISKIEDLPPKLIPQTIKWLQAKIKTEKEEDDNK